MSRYVLLSRYSGTVGSIICNACERLTDNREVCAFSCAHYDNGEFTFDSDGFASLFPDIKPFRFSSLITGPGVLLVCLSCTKKMKERIDSDPGRFLYHKNKDISNMRSIILLGHGSTVLLYKCMERDRFKATKRASPQ
jgi:hypothetical protein